MYLISYGQFNDVVRQENRRAVPGEEIVPPYDYLSRGEHWEIAGVRLYGRLIKTGTQDEYPILTFTATRDDFVVGPPSEAYIKISSRYSRVTTIDASETPRRYRGL